MTTTELRAAVADGEFPTLQGPLYIYTNGRHYEFAGTTTLDSWMCDGIPETSENVRSPSVQPILSNLDIDVPNPRRESDTESSRTVFDLQKQFEESVLRERQATTQSSTSSGD
jgi:hypothetical protein